MLIASRSNSDNVTAAGTRPPTFASTRTSTPSPSAAIVRTSPPLQIAPPCLPARWQSTVRRTAPPGLRKIYRSPDTPRYPGTSASAAGRVGSDVFSQRHGIGAVGFAVEPGVVVATIVVAIPAAVIVGHGPVGVRCADSLRECRRRRHRHQNGCCSHQDLQLSH